MKYKYPLASTTWDKAEYEAIQSVIKDGMFTMGPKVKEFENSFANYLGAEYCIMVNSGSSANLLMIAALFYTNNAANLLKRGDEVIVPAVSWSTTYFPLHQYGLKIKFVDIDIETLNYDLQALEEAVTEKTRVIMAVNLLGNPNDFNRIKSIIGTRQIILIEDNCESLGAEYQGKKTGTFGLMGSHSTFFSHHISTMEGGVISTNDEELYHILLSLRAHGWTRNLPKINHVCNDRGEDQFKESFRFILPGYNVRPLELSGAIGIEQLKKLPTLVLERQKNAEYLKNEFREHPTLHIQKEIGKSSWFGFSLIIRPEVKMTREELLIKLQKIGIEVRPIVAGNFTKNEVIKYFDSDVSGNLDNADYIDQKGLFVGNQHFPIISAIKELSKIK